MAMELSVGMTQFSASAVDSEDGLDTNHLQLMKATVLAKTSGFQLTDLRSSLEVYWVGIASLFFLISIILI
jgi:hypothetical protein